MKHRGTARVLIAGLVALLIGGCAAAGIAGGGARSEYVLMCRDLDAMAEAFAGEDSSEADPAISAFLQSSLSYAAALPEGDPDVRDGQAVEDSVMRFAAALDKGDVATVNESMDYFLLICEDYFAGEYENPGF